MAQLFKSRLSRRAALSRCEDRCGSGAFTLVELLLTIALMATLATLLMPGLATGKSKSQRTVCLNNLKQAGLSFLMYSADNDGRLPRNYPLAEAGSNCWVLGDMKVLSDATNATLIRQGKLFPYASDVALYRCPADSSRADDTPRVRSYSMNGWIGSRYMESYARSTGFRTFVRDSELAAAGPAKLWVIADEHEASIDDAWFLVPMDDGRAFLSLPATRHEGSYGLDFGDGHAELYKLCDPNSRLRDGRPSSFDCDWQKLRQVTTLR